MAEIAIETHPWQPFIPKGARILIMGTFPPQSKRWSMEFYYPNRTNDFWKVCGHIFFAGDQNALMTADRNGFDLEKIKKFLADKRIALSDTGYKVRRLMNNASDKYLEIVEPNDFRKILAAYPTIKVVATTGEKAATIVASLTGTKVPRAGEFTVDDNGIEIWRMPSTSRAYPISPTKKAECYKKMFVHTGIIE